MEYNDELGTLALLEDEIIYMFSQVTAISIRKGLVVGRILIILIRKSPVISKILLGCLYYHLRVVTFCISHPICLLYFHLMRQTSYT